MASRRTFLKASATALTAAVARPVLGAGIQCYAALPCLLALESLQKRAPVGWDATGRTSTSL